jgi:hypothetical protein
MTLDPVHFDGITRLAGRIEQRVDADDHRDFAATVWQEFLNPLRQDGRIVLEPLGERRKRAIDVEDAALLDRPFPTQHGLDAGTINPTTFKNGLVLDVAQAALSAVPSDLDLHRARSVVAAVHSNDATLSVGEDEWTMFDGGYSRGRILQTPRVDRYEQRVVHALALYLAESAHALLQADVVDDLLVMDGPIYPSGLLRWLDQDPDLADLVHERQDVRDVLENYVGLVERFAQRDVPLVGFVKNSTSKGITRAVRSPTTAPWVNDSAFFSKVLERREDGDLETDDLTFTNWFRSRCGTDRIFSTQGDALGIERSLDPEAYEVTFFVIYDPRDDLVYRIEAPYAFTQDEDMRENLTMQLLADVAAQRGPPLAVEKADELARISRQEKSALQDQLASTFDTARQREYDDKRWSGGDAGMS